MVTCNLNVKDWDCTKSVATNFSVSVSVWPGFGGFPYEALPSYITLGRHDKRETARSRSCGRYSSFTILYQIRLLAWAAWLVISHQVRPWPARVVSSRWIDVAWICGLTCGSTFRGRRRVSLSFLLVTSGSTWVPMKRRQKIPPKNKKSNKV